MTSAETAKRRVLLGYLSALGAAVAYAVVALMGKEIVSNHAPPVVGSAFSLMFGTIILGTLAYPHVVSDAVRAPRRAWILAAAAGLAATWGVSCWWLAMSTAPVVLVAPIVGAYPLFSIVLTHIFLKRLEKVTWRTVGGALLVVAGVIIIALASE